MPLMKGKSDKAFEHNIKTEYEHGHPLKQSLAIAYAMKRKHKKMAEGGMTDDYMQEDSPKEMSPIAKGMKKAFKTPMAEGGFLEEENASGYAPMHMPCEKCGHVSHPVENQDDHEDMVSEIMKSRKRYSHGGKVANDTPPDADFEENDFDVLPEEDDLEFHDTGKNSGDELGDKQEDEDRHDIVSQIMKSRKKKDKMPHPA